MRMIRTRLIAAVLVAGTLTGVVSASASPALANPTTATVGDTAEPAKQKPGEEPGTQEPAKQKPGEPGAQEPAKQKPGAGPGKQKPGKPGEPGKPGKPGGGQDVPEEAVKLLAAELGISVERSRQVFRDLEKVEARGDEITSDPAFVAIAEGLGRTPEELLAVLRKVKEAVGGIQKPKPDPAEGTTPDEGTASGSPTK
jgi:hypothetical protein